MSHVFEDRRRTAAVAGAGIRTAVAVIRVAFINNLFAAEAQIEFNRERIHGQSAALKSDLRELISYVVAACVVDCIGSYSVGAASGVCLAAGDCGADCETGGQAFGSNGTVGEGSAIVGLRGGGRSQGYGAVRSRNRSRSRGSNLQSAEVFGDCVVAGRSGAPINCVSVDTSTDFGDGAGCRYSGSFAGDKTGDGGLGVCQRGTIVGL